MNHKLAVNPVIVSDQEIQRRKKCLWDKAYALTGKKGLDKKKVNREQKEKEKEKFIQKLLMMFQQQLSKRLLEVKLNSKV